MVIETSASKRIVADALAYKDKAAIMLKTRCQAHEAVLYLESALGILEVVWGGHASLFGHNDTALDELFEHLADACSRLNRHKDALQYLERQLSLRIVMHGQSSTEALSTMLLMTRTNCYLRDFSSGLRVANQSLQVAVGLAGLAESDIEALSQGNSQSLATAKLFPELVLSWYWIALLNKLQYFNAEAKKSVSLALTVVGFQGNLISQEDIGELTALKLSLGS